MGIIKSKSNVLYINPIYWFNTLRITLEYNLPNIKYNNKYIYYCQVTPTIRRQLLKHKNKADETPLICAARFGNARLCHAIMQIVGVYRFPQVGVREGVVVRFYVFPQIYVGIIIISIHLNSNYIDSSI